MYGSIKKGSKRMSTFVCGGEQNDTRQAQRCYTSNKVESYRFVLTVLQELFCVLNSMGGEFSIHFHSTNNLLVHQSQHSISIDDHMEVLAGPNTVHSLSLDTLATCVEGTFT